MESKKISKQEWQKYFDSFSIRYLKDEQPEYIEIQVLSEDIGVQNEITWTPLKGIAYDPKSDILEIQIDKLDHLISHPQEIYVNEEDNGWLTGMMVIRRDGEKSIIDIR
ncbi:hypothetical protein CK503_00425 [Aliifodinibius salipaludis]|uniref:Uncharacterized protein n=1 Tax=Fodinibius salipaludis TaxID=2032627 RepID=A0A2A2GD57_9BACT|nr:DUF5335 family protein [Aliifodinibius salipaludis]PAU95566.1 hypothetical protein CK503_00425 [Aliifodinibius salipaludis]